MTTKNNSSQLDIRWQQRFVNFTRAFLLLKEALQKDINQFNQLEKEGIIQRFEYTFELAWKVLKDKMEHDGLIIDQISPKAVVKQAFTNKYIDDAAIWLKMIDDRNLMSHTYNFETFETIIITIKREYLPILDKWYIELQKEIKQK